MPAPDKSKEGKILNKAFTKRNQKKKPVTHLIISALHTNPNEPQHSPANKLNTQHTAIRLALHKQTNALHIQFVWGKVQLNFQVKIAIVYSKLQN